MTAAELRKIAKEHKIKLTTNGKYKTMNELKNEINNVNNNIEGEGIKHFKRKSINTLKKTHKITNKISKTIDKYSPIIETIVPELTPFLTTNKMYNIINGGSLSAKDTNDFLKASYSKKLKDINGYTVDKSLSGLRVQVYHNSQNNKTVVVHRGTDSIQDLGTNLSMSLGYKGKRFNHAKKIQKQAESKYGRNNLITMGHSQGARWSEMLGNKDNNNEVITFNKPTLPLDLLQGKKVKQNQTDIKTSRDPVSILRRFQIGKKAKVMKSKTFNLLKEHGVNALNRLNDNEMLGVPDNNINGGSMKSNFIKNIIYSKDFDPLKVKNPSKDILNKVNKQNPQIQFLKTLQTTIVKDNNELKTLKKYKDKKEVRSKLIDNLLLYRNKFKQLQKYFDINNNTILQKDANKIKKFLTNKTNKDFLNYIL